MNKDSNPAISKPSEIGTPELTEIEITPAMIAAGIEAFEDWEMRDDWSSERLVCAVYLRMKNLSSDE